MRVLLAATLLLGLLVPLPAPAQTVVIPGMPVDYDGIAFGTQLRELTDAGLVFFEQVQVPNELMGDYTVEYYVRQNPRQTFAGVALAHEAFGMENGRFSHILLSAKGRDAFDAFVAHAAQEYGMEDAAPFSVPDYPDCVKIHRVEDYDGSEGHAWLWGVQQSDDVFMAVRVRYDPATNQATYRVGWPY